jgi:hypothetical protein
MGQAYVPRITVDSRLVGQTQESYNSDVLALLQVGSEVYPGGYRLDQPGGGYRNFYVATTTVNNITNIYLVCYSLSYTAELPEATFSNMGVYIVANS